MGDSYTKGAGRTGERKRTFRVRGTGRLSGGRAVDPVLAQAGIATPLAPFERVVVGITTVRSDLVGATGVLGIGDAAPSAFGQVIEDLGGVPVLLPPVVSIEAVRRHIALIDGLLLTDGPDVHPNLSGGRPRAGGRYDPLKDRYEWLLLERALDAGLPLLAIGRGLGLLNLVLGGTVEDNAGSEPVEVHPGIGVLRDGPNVPKVVSVSSGSLLGEALGGASLRVRLSTTQGIGRLACRLIAVGRGDGGSIEAAEVQDLDFAIGVRFSPEYMLGQGEAGRRLLAALLKAAGCRRRPASPCEPIQEAP